MVIYEAKELLTVKIKKKKKKSDERNWQCFISQWIWIENGLQVYLKIYLLCIGGLPVCC